jgi:hypothetical protein
MIFHCLTYERAFTIYTRMNRFTFFVLMAAVLLFSCSDRKSAQTEKGAEKPLPDKPLANPIEGFVPYRFSDFPIRVQYPKDWSVHKDKIGVSFFIPGTNPEDRLIEGVTILVDEMHGARMSLKDYTKIVIPDLKKRTPGFALTSSGETTLGGEPAYMLAYEGLFNTSKMTYTSIYCLKDDILCVVSVDFTLGQKETYAKEADVLISSFEFL